MKKYCQLHGAIRSIGYNPFKKPHWLLLKAPKNPIYIPEKDRGYYP